MRYKDESGMVTFILEKHWYNVKTLEEGLKGWSSALEQLLLGSTASGVVTYSECPVLVTK